MTRTMTAGIRPRRFHQNSLSPAQYRARLKILGDVAQAGGDMTDAAQKIGMTTAGVSVWCSRHNPALGAVLAKNGRAAPKPRLTDEQNELRLRLVLEKGQRGAARELGISEAAISAWYVAYKARLVHAEKKAKIRG